ncbi:MAG: FG-GAP repeat domain-containing protein [Candidatus Hodarchaeales archaeon]
MKFKKHFLISCLFLFLICTLATKIPVRAENIAFTEIVITDNVLGIVNVEVADMDGDNDLDIVAGSAIENKIVLFKNDNGSFSSNIITDDFREVIKVSANDIDQDGDLDILGAARVISELAWWENQQNVYIKHILSSNYVGAETLSLFDVDQDGDNDFLSTAKNDISWWENTENNEFVKHTLVNRSSSSNRGYIFGVFAIDFDKDGDIDLISADNSYTEPTDDVIFLFENNGSNFFSKILFENTKYQELHGFFIIDFDDDEDFDFLCTSPSQRTIDWFENNGTNILTRHTLLTDLYGANSVFPTDIDQDGDLDLISAIYFDNKISWFENNGENMFIEHILSNSFIHATSVLGIDFDYDMDIDIVANSYEGKIYLWENNLDPKLTDTSTGTDTDQIVADEITTASGLTLFITSSVIFVLLLVKRKNI